MIRERQRKGLTRPRQQSVYRARKKSLADSEVADLGRQIDAAQEAQVGWDRAEIRRRTEQLVGTTRRPWIRAQPGNTPLGHLKSETHSA